MCNEVFINVTTDNSDSALFKLDQLIGIFLGCILAFVILSLSVLAMLMIKRKNKRIKRLKGGLRSAAEGDPDIIPHAPGKYAIFIYIAHCIDVI